MNITTDQLQAYGFTLQACSLIASSSDQTPFTYQKEMPERVMQLCFDANKRILRFRTIGLGLTLELKGVQTMEELKQFYQLVSGKELTKTNTAHKN
jgi:hypothetical protein